ncbi:hypothetical protein TURU_030558 [Turdus rufiventris]|nr:hypothetical protein TURU_030558 [Turdus rufiventris]
MGNTTSCCVSSSPKLRRNAHSRLESYRPEAELSREDTGCNLQHISDRENIDVLEPLDEPCQFISDSDFDIGDPGSLAAIEWAATDASALTLMLHVFLDGWRPNDTISVDAKT